jgi:hypothetical protein
VTRLGVGLDKTGNAKECIIADRIELENNMDLWDDGGRTRVSLRAQSRNGRCALSPHCGCELDRRFSKKRSRIFRLFIFSAAAR